MTRPGYRKIARWAVVVATALCAWLTFAKLRVSSDLSTLFPDKGEATALSRWTHAFGGRDPAMVLIRGEDPERVSAVANAIAASLRRAPSIKRVIDGAPHLSPPGDPTLAWAYAGPEARAHLEAAVSPSGMHDRLVDTRALLLSPVGSQDASAWLARDPLRLAQVPWESRAELAAGVRASLGGAFSADGGRARLVLAEPRGSAFSSDAARAVVEDVERAEAEAAQPGVTTALTGAHAVARATEQMLRRDLALSGTLSAVLASLAFVATFRRARALLAVLPPLALGTLWTTGIAALFPGGLNALSIAFAAVVVGVGVDTGVHVYAALLDARRAGHGPSEAASQARANTWRPTLTAAAIAAVAFASLGLGGLRAIRQLGLLCGAGELLTAVAILLVTPEIGAWLERGTPPAARSARWIGVLAWLTQTRKRALVALAVCATPALVLFVLGWPRPADALVAIRPSSLAPLAVETEVHALFGGRSGQWIVLTTDADEEHARARADRIAEALEPLVHAHVAEGFDSLATFAPSVTTQRARLAERDALDLPGRRATLAAALTSVGFSVEECSAALDAFAHPSEQPLETHAGGADADDALSWLAARHVARDGDQWLVATYVRATGDSQKDAALRAAILAADPGSVITGYGAIDRALREALDRNLVLVGAVSLVVVAIAMRLALHSVQHTFVALATLACEMAAVGVVMHLLGIRWHVYDALVLPVLFGVTIDESMFLLHAAKDQSLEAALHAQGPLVTATALTTAAGFVALVACRFDGLRDLGAVGTCGVLAGLVAALVVVPATLRLTRRES